jgi:hypothetical protein
MLQCLPSCGVTKRISQILKELVNPQGTISRSCSSGSEVDITVASLASTAEICIAQVPLPALVDMSGFVPCENAEDL